MAKKYSRFTEREYARIAELRNQGKSFAEISRVMKRSYPAVRATCKWLAESTAKTAKVVTPPSDELTAYEMIRAGRSMIERGYTSLGRIHYERRETQNVSK